MVAVTTWHCLAYRLYRRGIPWLPGRIQLGVRLLYSCYLPYQTEVGRGTLLGYGGLGVVIHRRCKIDEDCVISQGVTLGGTSKKHEVPVLGNRVYVGVGAKVIGPVIIGDEAAIGANAVVLQDIPARCLAVGIPARIVKTGISSKDYV